MLLLLAACETTPPGALGPHLGTGNGDGASVTVDADGIVVTDPGGTDHRVHLQLGFVTDPDDAANYDPWNLVAEDKAYAVPDGVVFADAVALDCASLSCVMDLGDGEIAALAVDPTGPGFRFRIEHDDDARWAPYARIAIDVAVDEAFYGLGEIFASVEHRGEIHPMQIEIDLGLESAYNEVHVPVPLLVSSAGWGLLVDSRWPGVFDVAATDPGQVSATFNQHGGIEFDVYVPGFDGGAGLPSQVTELYHRRTGMPEIPPSWAFAPLQWRNEVVGEADVVADALAIRDLGLATGVLWVDNPWQTTYNSMVPDNGMFPNWDAMIADLHELGFRMLAWTTPYLESDEPEHDAYADAGWLLDAPLLLNNFGDMVDLTNEDAAAAWRGRVEVARARGIEGWKLDYGEDVQVGIGPGRMPWAFANGEDERTMHHEYTRYFHDAYSRGFEDQGVLIGRAGVLGGHVITDVIWPGDLDNGFERWRDEGCDDKLCVGGLPSAIRGGTSLAASGYPFFASDTGGYRGGRPTKESFVRWMEYAALLPIWQYGGAGENHNPWDFSAYGDSQFDQEVLDAFARYAQLHTRLYPYYAALAERTGTAGTPSVMAQGYAYPAEGHHPDNAFLVGADLYLAPVEEEGVASWTFTPPPGTWVHWWTGEAIEGGTEVSVGAPLGAGPLYQRAGSAIPMLRRSVVTLSPAGEGVDSWSSDPGMLSARVVPADGAGFTLSSGESIAWSGSGATLADGALYAGWDVEAWIPGATGASADGVDLEPGSEGCTSCVIVAEPWIRAVVPAGTSRVEFR
jgi:alpha-D-xyloside xylohydrolase